MAGFVMAGAAPHHAKGIQTLGSINYQPLWCFYRSPVPLPIKERETLILSHNVNMGTTNSGTHLLMQEMLKLNGINGDLSKFKQYPDEQAIEMLRDGRLDSVCIVDTYESPNVQKLLKIPGLQLSAFERAEAYARMVPALEMVTIPEGALDLPTNRPSTSSPMIATTTEILIDERLHPAIQTLFLMAAKDINGKESFFSKRGSCPVFMDSCNTGAKRHRFSMRKGRPF